jgi:hypothetical protein
VTARDARRPTPEQRQQAGRDLVWMLAFLAGLLVPLGAGLLTPMLTVSVPVRLAAVLVALIATDVPLVVAVARGRGAVGVVQPWRWSAYLAWLAIRLAILVPLAMVPWEA